mgnify:CR=1 FL=1
MHRSDYYPFGLPVSREACGRYTIDALYGHAEERPLSLARATRELTERMNARRDFSRPKVLPARAGELLSAGLLTEILRYVADVYCTELFPKAWQQSLDWTSQSLGEAVAERPLPVFVGLFPPGSVRLNQEDKDQFLARENPRLSHREIALREIVLLHLTNENPALQPYVELFDDMEMKHRAPYEPLLSAVETYFTGLPPFPETGQKLLAMLRAPMRHSPQSIEDQLEYIRSQWRNLLPDDLFELLLRAQDILKEELVLRGHGPGAVCPLEFGWLADLGYAEPEAFSTDRDWMPNLVLIAKSIYVWLDQLSRKYQRSITRLDEIPDEELDRLARWGFSGLWLIGIWERSPASQEIKQRMGNPEALASAYSVYDYVVAHAIGGEEAYRNLAGRAWQRGIRLASDMVPNHVGLYSKWVVEHPDWFIQLSYPPYPVYRFTGPNLSRDDRVGLYIEDGYWDRRDAAVVFKRVDHATGDTRYLYHGNDGTNMPWNDTAQLNFLIPEVREAVINTILHVARNFPIIRFDAAMTLAKRHYQRLWFPKPGDAGAIPSRAEQGMNKAQFDAVFPKEFWREVVDRVAEEAPDTLLLAEAFWLMEGYFVRTLGMHRVYNSAFMNMLKMEDNANYRQTIKNVLEFSPEVIQRFVNFMNNPDEETAEAQFGRGDKYFGIALMMVTMPGLPMFGHGQIEGFTEKYGMEYRRAYWDESVDEHLVARHEAEIFPVMRKRHIFSGAQHFAFFDFNTQDGWVDENVFAYSNRCGNERALILYNNVYPSTRGTIHLSTSINMGTVDTPCLKRITLAEALDLCQDDTVYYVFRDYHTGLEYLRHTSQLTRHGFYTELSGYQYCALLDWREIHDMDSSWGRFHAELGDRGVPSMNEAYHEFCLRPILEPFRKVMNGVMLRGLVHPEDPQKALDDLTDAMTPFLEAVGAHIGQSVVTEPILDAIKCDLQQIWGHEESPSSTSPQIEEIFLNAYPEGMESLAFWRVPISWGLVRHLGMAALSAPMEKTNIHEKSAAWLRDWFLLRPIAAAFESLDGNGWRADMDARLTRVLVVHASTLPLDPGVSCRPVMERLFHDPDVAVFLQLNRFEGHVWFNKEQFERMVTMMSLVQSLICQENTEKIDLTAHIKTATLLLDTAAAAEYDVDRFLDVLSRNEPEREE